MNRIIVKRLFAFNEEKQELSAASVTLVDGKGRERVLTGKLGTPVHDSRMISDIGDLDQDTLNWRAEKGVTFEAIKWGSEIKRVK